MPSPLLDPNTVLLWLFNDALNNTTASEWNGYATMTGLQASGASVGGHISQAGIPRNALTWVASGVWSAASPSVQCANVAQGSTTWAAIAGALTADWTLDLFVQITGTPYAGAAVNEYELLRVYAGATGPTVDDYALRVTFTAASNGGQPTNVKVYQSTDGTTQTAFLTAPYAPTGSWDSLTIRRYLSGASTWTYELWVNGSLVGSATTGTNVYQTVTGLTTNYVRWQCPASVCNARLSKVKRTLTEIGNFAASRTTPTTMTFLGARILPYMQITRSGTRTGVSNASGTWSRNFRTMQRVEVIRSGTRTGSTHAPNPNWQHNIRHMAYHEISRFGPALRGYLASNLLIGYVVEDNEITSSFGSPITLGIATPTNLGYRITADMAQQTTDRGTIKLPIRLAPVRRRFWGIFDQH